MIGVTLQIGARPQGLMAQDALNRLGRACTAAPSEQQGITGLIK